MEGRKRRRARRKYSLKQPVITAYPESQQKISISFSKNALFVVLMSSWRVTIVVRNTPMTRDSEATCGTSTCPKLRKQAVSLKEIFMN
jgi:hypothetical protein